MFINGEEFIDKMTRSMLVVMAFRIHRNQTGNTLNNIIGYSTTNWGRTSNTVWVINTTANKVVLNPTQIAATTLYDQHLRLGITVSNGDIIELRRSVQDLKTPAVDLVTHQS